MPRLPIIWAARMVAAWRSPEGPELISPKNSSSDARPPRAIWISPWTSDSDCRKRSSRSEWASRPRVGQQAEGVLALDDREDLELAALAHQPGDGGVARFVGGDNAPFGLGVLHRLGQADLLGHLGLLQVGPVEAVGPPAQRPHEGFVEEVLDHHRAVARCHGRGGVP
jgi:hypothetical protein